LEKKNLSEVEPFHKNGLPLFPAGQIIFDINGEYANPNLQDEGTAISELFSSIVTRYSVIPKPDFKVMKVNFYNEISSGFELIKSHLELDTSDYVKSFLAIDLNEPDAKDFEGDEIYSAKTRYGRIRAAYLCCLWRAGFPTPKGFTISFTGEGTTLNGLVKEGGLDPSKGITLSDATNWFTTIWEKYESEKFFEKYKKDKGHEWADEDLQALLVSLTRKSKQGGNSSVNGYLKIRGIKDLHTDTVGNPFEQEIIEE
jgi:hypothetical protein